MHGFFNKVLNIDLAARTSAVESVPDEVLRRYLGGKGLATWLLLRDNPAGVDPLGPDNRLIFAVGPLTDLKVNGSARFGVFSKSPLTGFYSESYSGGTVADQISRVGVEAVVLFGAAPEPVWIEVSDRGVRFHDAADLWGMEAYAAEDALKERVGVPQAGVVVIGPAGEKLVRFATINNNYWRCAGRTGLGAVLGSKRVKGIAFHGRQTRAPADPELLAKHGRALNERAKTNPGVATYQKYGTVNMVSIANENGVFPTRYWTRGRREDFRERLSAEAMYQKCKVKARACPRCFMACGKRCEVRAGRHAGLSMEGPEFETIYAFGGLCLIEEFEDIIFLNDLCDRLGLDTITAGNLVGFTMHAAERGAIREKVNFGDVDATVELIRQMAARTGLGAVLADGIVPAARAWSLSDDAVHVKGLEPAAYDPRPLKGMGLAYAVSDRGACHLRATFYKAELSGLIAPAQVEGKAELFLDFEDRATLFDCLILCRFFRDLLQWEELAVLVKGATGMELDRAGLKRIAAQVTDATRIFNLREGVTAADDTLPKFILSNPLQPSGKSINLLELQTMVQDYYRLRGWNQSGEPPEWLHGKAREET